MAPSSLTDASTAVALRLLAVTLQRLPSKRRWLRGVDGWIDFSIALMTEDGGVAHTVRFEGGKVRVQRGVARDVDTKLIFRDPSVLRALLKLPPNEVLNLLMRGDLRSEGNLSYLSLFELLLSLALGWRYKGLLAQARVDARLGREQVAASGPTQQRAAPTRERLTAEGAAGVRWLGEAHLGRYSLDDFPRLREGLERHFTTQPELCAERPLLLTRWLRANGFEAGLDAGACSPVLRQARALAYLLREKQPIIGKGDLLAGTTTTREVGVVLYPDAHGTLIWGELLTLSDRPLNPYRVSEETIATLHGEVFPFWIHRNFREWVRERYAAPLCQQLDERFAVYFCWKTVALSHTIPDFPLLLRKGVGGILAEIEGELAQTPAEQEGKRETLSAMVEVLRGLTALGRRLAAEAQRSAEQESDPQRRGELSEMAEVCARVAEQAPRTLHEALQVMWTTWIALHMENTNAGLSLGRLDLWLQPFLDADMAKLGSAQEREAYLRRAIDLVGCFYLRCADHLPLVPDIGNHLFGGSSSDQAITLGGVGRDGQSAVSDMSYLLLKVTEMLKLRDPNVNARFSVEKNDAAFLRRLCEVNLVTCATPSIHGDENVMRAIGGLGLEPDDVRDWAATGCVEPTISGRHMGHTGSMMFSLVAPLEMALYDGRHPLLRAQVGPRTGSAAGGDFATFEEFYAAYCAQLSFLVDQATEYNHMLGEAHAVLRPTPLLSALIEGPRSSGHDVTAGGARYNTSGVACIGLADVVDSLQTIRTLVFTEKTASFDQLAQALAADFVGHEALHARILRKVPKYGSGDEAALDLARRVTALVHGLFAQKRSYRGGPYTTGFWSMSNHVAFGGLTGALPSGRRAAKAFTPGLTPSPMASPNLLDNLRDVAALDPANLDNNVAFNVKYVPSARDGHARSVDTMAAYAKTYFELGGLQMQLNVVSSAVLRDAMARPEDYRDLLVRISGYNAYFVTLSREMQVELVERAEYGAGLGG